MSCEMFSLSNHQFVSIKFSCLIESNVSLLWHWVMSHCYVTDQSEASIVFHWPVRGRDWDEWCEMLWLPGQASGHQSVTYHGARGDQRGRPQASHIVWCHRKGRSHFVVVTIITPAPGCRQSLGQGHYFNLTRGLTRSGDINAALRVDHDWAWLETTCLLRAESWDWECLVSGPSAEWPLRPIHHTLFRGIDSWGQYATIMGKLHILQDDFCCVDTYYIVVGLLRVVNKRALDCGFDYWMCIGWVAFLGWLGGNIKIWISLDTGLGGILPK